MNLFSIIGLQESYLDDPCVVWIQLIKYRIDFLIREEPVLRASHIIEELDETFSCAKIVKFCWVIGISLQECDVKPIGLDEVRKLLDALLGPSLGTSEELSGVFLLEVIDRLLEFYLSCAKGMNLHELLKVEESLRDREFVTAA